MCNASQYIRVANQLVEKICLDDLSGTKDLRRLQDTAQYFMEEEWKNQPELSMTLARVIK